MEQSTTYEACTGCGLDGHDEDFPGEDQLCPDCRDCLDCCEENHESDFPGKWLGRCFNANREAWQAFKEDN